MKLGAVYLMPLLIHLTFLSFGTVSLVINLLEHPVFCAHSRFPFDKFVIGDERPVLQTIRLGIVQSKKGTIALFLARLSRLE